MPDIILPVQGESPWGAKLTAAIVAINSAVEALEAAGVDAAAVRTLIGSTLLATGNLELVATGSPAGTTYTVRTTTAFTTALNRKVDSDDIDTVRVMTQAAYTALATKDTRTFYAIVG